MKNQNPVFDIAIVFGFSVIIAIAFALAFAL
jgi:hypothetical protein